MSWHCPYCGGDNFVKGVEKKPHWVKIMVGLTEGGIPFTFVAHAECMKDSFTADGVDGLQDKFDNYIDENEEREPTEE